MTHYEKALTEAGLNLTSQDLPSCMRAFALREHLIRLYSFAILDTATIEALRPYAPILEVGSGTGYWAMELRKAGIDILATDKEPGCQFFFDGKTWISDIIQIDALEAINKYFRETLLICWPTFGDDWAKKALDAFHGQYVLFVGEGDGGCTADDGFFESLERNWVEEKYIKIPQWYGIFDCLVVYRPKVLQRRIHWR